MLDHIRRLCLKPSACQSTGQVKPQASSPRPQTTGQPANCRKHARRHEQNNASDLRPQTPCRRQSSANQRALLAGGRGVAQSAAKWVGARRLCQTLAAGVGLLLGGAAAREGLRRQREGRHGAAPSTWGVLKLVAKLMWEGNDLRSGDTIANSIMLCCCFHTKCLAFLTSCSHSLCRLHAAFAKQFSVLPDIF